MQCAIGYNWFVMVEKYDEFKDTKDLYCVGIKLHNIK